MPRQRACNASEFREKERMPMAEKTDARVTDEKVVEIEMERLREFSNHPFKVCADSQMIQLQDNKIFSLTILNISRSQNTS